MRLLLVICILAFPFQQMAAHEKAERVKKCKYDLGICAIFQNEERFLKEWIEFHRLVGVRHFYLFNNLSTDHYLSVLQPFIDKGIVELIDWPFAADQMQDWNTIQCRAYQEGIERAKGNCYWLALIDTDEFLVPVSKKRMNEILSDYNSYARVCLNWQMYGTSHVSKVMDNQLLIEKLLMKAPVDYGENIHVKSIVKPHRVSSCDNPHYVHYQQGYFAVNSSKEPCPGPFNVPILLEAARVNHYWARDEEFLHHIKIPRNVKMWGGQIENILERVNTMNQIYDPIMLRYAEELRKRMGLDALSLT